MPTRYSAKPPSEQPPPSRKNGAAPPPVQLDLEDAVAASKGWSARPNRSNVAPFRRRALFRTVHSPGARKLYPFAATDFVTLLTAAGKSKILTKRISLGADGTPVLRDYEQAKHFLFEKRTVGGLSDIAGAIDSVGPNAALVLGEPTDAAVMGARRLAYDRPETGERATLSATAHRWLPIDIDSIPCPDGLDPIADPEAAVEHVVRQYLPAETHDRDLYWQLTSGAGIKPGIRLRLCFWLDRPLSCKEMKEWLGGLDYVDASIYTPNQLIYCAKPIFAKNVTDPVPRRSGILTGTYRTVRPPDPLPQRGRETPGSTPRPNGLDGASSGARGYAAWCQRIGDHPEGEGFHGPIKKAIGAYVGANGSVNTELLRAQLERAIRAAPRNPSAHSDSYIEKQIRDLPRLIEWTQEQEARPREEGPAAQQAAAPTDQDDAAIRVAEHIATLNKFFAVVQVGSRVAILREYDGEDGRPTFSLMGVDAFKQWVANSSVKLPDKQGNEVKWPSAPLWLNSPKRREYEGIVFKPGKLTPRFYNLWCGFAVEPREDGSCELFKAHLLDNVCKGDRVLYQWVFGWFADIFQHPARKCGTSLVLSGGQGVGKTIVGKTFGYLLGTHYTKVASPRYVSGRFNAHLERTLLFHADEAFWAGDHAAEGLIKDLITGEDHPIERKGFEVIFVGNYVRVLISGNADWLAPAGMDERRFTVLNVDEKHKQDIPYFKAIVDELETGGYERLLYELLTFDLSQVELRVTPKTAALLDQKLASLDSKAAWWLNILREGRLPSRGISINSALPPNQCYRKQLLDDYIQHAKEVGERRRANETELGIFLRKIVTGLKKKQLNTPRRPRVYILPPLAECRKAFERELGQSYDWEEGAPKEWEGWVAQDIDFEALRTEVHLPA